MKIKDIINELESFAPLQYQEQYDNSGLLIGSPNQEVNSALCSLDVTNEVLDEAIATDCGLVIAHHPLIFGSIKRLNGSNENQRLILKAIQNNLAIYACHTNLDNVQHGVNKKICDKLRLENCKILSPLKSTMVKLVVFVPTEHAERVRNAVFLAGAGHIGKYDSCSYNLEGYGTFRGSENTNPYVGKKGELHTEKETRIETIVPSAQLAKVLQAMIKFHPYEEVAYDIYPLQNKQENAGAGMIGELPAPVTGKKLLELCKTTFKCNDIAFSGSENSTIKKVAVCGGSGSFLIDKAAQKADAFITGDIKYHQFLDADKGLFLMDIGHFESEQFTPEIFYDIIKEKFPTFAVRLSEVCSNPVKHYS